MPQWLVAILAIGQPLQLFAVLRLDAGRGVAASVSRQCMRMSPLPSAWPSQPTLQRSGLTGNTASRLPG